MPYYKMTGTYEYSGTVEADSEEEAWTKFYADLNDYYVMPVTEDIEEEE